MNYLKELKKVNIGGLGKKEMHISFGEFKKVSEGHEKREWYRPVAPIMLEKNSKYSIKALINTSFNIKGEPIVYTTDDAIKSAKKHEY